MWPGYHMFFRKQCWHLVNERTLGLMNALKYHGCKTSLYLKLFWSMWCPKISWLRNLCRGPVLYPAKSEEIYGIVPYQKFFMSCYTLLTSTCGSQVGLDCSVDQWVKWVNRCNPLQPWFSPVVATYDLSCFDNHSCTYFK